MSTGSRSQTDDGEAPASDIPAALLLRPPESLFDNYQINVVVDHQHRRGAPVVVETNPTYYNLVGRIEHEAEFGALITDFQHDQGRVAAAGQRRLPGGGCARAAAPAAGL